MFACFAMPLADGCHHVFIDVGANIGMHSRFLFEPDQYPLSPFNKRVFNRYFGAHRDLRSTCAISFEPNPRHAARHKKLEAAYARRGWRYVPIHAGVGPKAGNMTFYTNMRRERKSLGAAGPEALGIGFSSVDREQMRTGTDAKYNFDSAQQAITRPVVDLATWIQAHVEQRRLPPAATGWLPPAVVVKMDVEGAEFAIVPRLLQERALCAVNFISFEWHTTHKFLPLHFVASPQNITVRTASEAGERKRALKAALSALSAESGCASHFEHATVDDESYFDDGVPLPL